MPAVVSFRRLYLNHPAGLEYPATPAVVSAVLRSMNAAAGGEVPFNTQFRLDDGSTVIAKPRRR